MNASDIDVVCGACGSSSVASGRFCPDCGHPLYEQCDCGETVGLGQAFCNGCGTDLRARLQQRRGDIESTLRRVEQSAADGDYASALSRLECITGLADYRFADLVARGRALQEKYRDEWQRWQQRIESVGGAARASMDAREYGQVIRLIDAIPHHARPEFLVQMRAQAAAQLEAETSWKKDLRQALERGDLALAIRSATCLAQSKPRSQSRRQRQQKLIAAAERRIRQLLDAQRFSQCLELFESLPKEARTDALAEIAQRAADRLVQIDLLSRAGYASAPLLELAQSIQRDAIQVPHLDRMVDNLRRQLQRHAPTLPIAFPPRRRLERPGPQPHCVPVRVPLNRCTPEVASRARTVEHLGRILIAYGLAIQAADNAIPQGDLRHRGKRRLGTFLPVGRPRSTRGRRGWGIDVGHSWIKAVRVTAVDDDWHIDQIIVVPVGVPDGSLPGGEGSTPAVEAAVEELVSRIDVGRDPVWISFPAPRTIVRHLLLPAGLDAPRIDQFAQQEIVANTPLAAGDAVYAYWVGPPTASSSSVPAVLVATDRQRAESHRGLVQRAGMTVAGMLPDTLALYVAQRHLQGAIAAHVAPSLPAAQCPNAVDVWLDIGATATRILIVGPHVLWQRTIDWGFHRFGTAIAAASQATRERASALARSPIGTGRASCIVGAMQQEAAKLRRHLELSLRASRDTLGERPVARILMTGGGAGLPLLADWVAGHEF